MAIKSPPFHFVRFIGASTNFYERDSWRLDKKMEREAMTAAAVRQLIRVKFQSREAKPNLAERLHPSMNFAEESQLKDRKLEDANEEEEGKGPHERLY